MRVYLKRSRCLSRPNAPYNFLAQITLVRTCVRACVRAYLKRSRCLSRPNAPYSFLAQISVHRKSLHRREKGGGPAQNGSVLLGQ